MSITIWGQIFENRRIILNSDNKGVVFAMNCLASKSEPVVILLREIVLQCLIRNIWLRAKYLEGHKNIIADALVISSTYFRKRFRKQTPLKV